MPDINDMILFAEVAKAGGFTKAANTLGRPKSSISYRISKLEAELGARLLERTTRRIRLTEAGRLLLEHCNHIIEEVELATNVVETLSRRPKGLLRLTASYSVGRQLLGPIANQYLQLYPDTKIQLILSNRRVDIIEEGFDLAIRVGPLAKSNFIAKRIGGSRLAFCTSVEYLKGIKQPRTPDDLAALRVLHMSEYDFPTSLKLQGPTGIEVYPIRLRGVINDFHLLKKMIQEGAGVAILPTYMCYEELAEGKLVEILPEWSIPEVVFHAVYPSHRGMTPKVRAFLDLLETHIATRTDWGTKTSLKG